MSLSINNFFNDLITKDVIYSHKGDINAELIHKLIATIESRIEKSDVTIKVQKRVVNVLIESLQNLYHHLDKMPNDFEDQDIRKFGIIVIYHCSNCYGLVTGNFIYTEKIKSLKDKIIKINNSTPEELRLYYKDILNDRKLTEKGGGGLGLIDIARKTGNILDYKFTDYNSKYSFYELKVKIEF